jgi:hypothetical protein
MMVIENKYDFGQIVFLKCDVDQSPRIVVSIEVYKGGELMYKLSAGDNNSLHFDFEISEEKNFVNV